MEEAARRLRLQDVADQLPGTVGFVIPDRYHLVYLEFARAANALGLHEGGPLVGGHHRHGVGLPGGDVELGDGEAQEEEPRRQRQGGHERPRQQQREQEPCAMPVPEGQV